MTKIVYEVIPARWRWAFKLGDTISDTFPATTKPMPPPARRARTDAPGQTVGISWEDAKGRWHDEISSATIARKSTSSIRIE